MSVRLALLRGFKDVRRLLLYRCGRVCENGVDSQPGRAEVTWKEGGLCPWLVQNVGCGPAREEDIL